ncbi:MAG: hypothetical protein ABJE95_33685 [Byssovorax sp.]
MDELPPPKAGYRYVFVASYWHWGLRRRLFAREKGLKAFRLEVRIDGPRRLPPDHAARQQQHASPAAPIPRRAVKRKSPRKSS